MRQIGARQESARIGGLGACGRELCCSTWLTDFKSVTTSAARYQNLSINQTKLSGQCGRLKCCLNYELDTYMDALKDFPKDVDRLKTEAGRNARANPTTINAKIEILLSKFRWERSAYIKNSSVSSPSLENDTETIRNTESPRFTDLTNLPENLRTNDGDQKQTHSFRTIASSR